MRAQITKKKSKKSLLSPTWETIPNAWRGLGDSSRGSASFPGSQAASLEKKAKLWAKAVIAATNIDSQTYTNQKAARGAALHTGRRGEEAGLLEGSYQAWASNWVPKQCRSNFILMNYIQFLTILKSQKLFFSKYFIFYATQADLSVNSYRCFEGRQEMSEMELHPPRNTSQVS